MRGDIAMFLGLVAVVGGGIIVAIVFVFGDSGGGGNSPCDRPLAPIRTSNISQLGFQTEDVGLAKVIVAASAGNADAAEEAFSFENEGEVHNFTHNVDPPLREVDESLAKELCKAVTDIEEELLLERRPAAIATHARRIQELLRDAAEALGFARPGG